jgi:hypothetical protein
MRPQQELDRDSSYNDLSADSPARRCLQRARAEEMYCQVVVLVYPIDRHPDPSLDERRGWFTKGTSEHHALAESNRPRSPNEGLVVEVKDHQIVPTHVQAVVLAFHLTSFTGEVMIMRQIYGV